MEKIFIHIASYRDPELIPTIKDCLLKAKYPERLRFGIVWQHSKEDIWDSMDDFKNDSRFKILDIKWNETNGTCWARHQGQKLWNGEEYSLQLDSHHRFIKDWDEILIKMLKTTGSQKPIISSYVNDYSHTNNDYIEKTIPTQMSIKKFGPEKIPLFWPSNIDKNLLEKPAPSRFFSGHFAFTLGIHNKEVPYDPFMYFDGEEISMAVRSYTHGYDLFIPNKVVIFHEFDRGYRVKHWDDYSKKNNNIKKTFSELDIESKKRYRQLFKIEDNKINMDIYGFGKERTLEDYETYAGINFKKQTIHPDTLNDKIPPVKKLNYDWSEKSLNDYKIKLDWSDIWSNITSQLKDKEEFDFIFLGIQDKFNETLTREDLIKKEELNGMITNKEIYVISDKEPYSLLLWPHVKNGEYLEKVSKKLKIKKLVIFGKKDCTRCDRLREILPDIIQILNITVEKNDITSEKGAKAKDEYNSRGFKINETPVILVFDSDKLVGRIEGVSDIDTKEERVLFFLDTIRQFYDKEKD